MARVPTVLAPKLPWWRLTARRLLAIAIALSTVFAIYIAAGFRLYVRPQVDALRHADAIMVIGGYGLERYPFGIRLAQEGWAPNLLLSNPDNAEWLNRRCGKIYPISQSTQCIYPNPPTTLGEARELRRLAAKNNWTSVIVVTFRPHISRARFIFEQCFAGNLIMMASPAKITLSRWVSEYGYQTAGFAKAMFDEKC